MERMIIKNKLIQDWSRPGLTTAAIGVGQQGTSGNYATVGGRRGRRKKMKKGGGACEDSRRRERKCAGW